MKYRELIRKNTISPSQTGEKDWVSCLQCASPGDLTEGLRCKQCSGALEIFYDLSRARIYPEEISPLLRFRDILPLSGQEARFWLGEGNTPCVSAQRLGKTVGLPGLHLKDETSNPTRSTKDRIASVGLGLLARLGISEFVMTSTGNSSTSFARGVQLCRGFKAHIFVGTDFLDRLNYVDHPDVFTYVVDGDFVKAGKLAKEFADGRGIYFEGGFFSVGRREGLKVSYLEAFTQLATPPDFVFQAISSGMGLLGAYKGALELSAIGALKKVPRMVAVQQASCAPMVRAFQDKAEQVQKEHIVEDPQGIASAILRGDPSQSYPYIRNLVIETGGTLISVTENEIRTAQEKVFEYEGLRICFSSAAAVAGAIKLSKQGNIDSKATVLINVTGADRPKEPVPTSVIKYDERFREAA